MSFSEDGYQMHPKLVVILLTKERKWERVGHVWSFSKCLREEDRGRFWANNLLYLSVLLTKSW